MDKKELVDRLNDPKYIPGIYNYCDRWCERCQFTSRCLNCEIAEEEFGDFREIDLRNKEFWQKFSETLQNNLALLKETAEEEGIDIEAIIAEQTDNDDTGEENSVIDLLSHMSMNYAKSVNDWFESNEHLFQEKEDKMNRIRLLATEDNYAKEAASISDSVEVIGWYQYQIHTKIARACESTSVEESEDKGLPKDSDGSAKVALIGIDRSIAAWRIFMSSFPEQKKQIAALINNLENIRKRVEIRFPRARDFIRPGFDEIK
ncbi:MAG: hypothetical protein R6V20_01415 [Desulfobia sp.]